jgi:PAS domain S-box-containing protein
MAKNWTINRLITVGFSLLLAIFIAVATINLIQIRELEGSFEKVAALRTPTAMASTGIVNQINRALGALRGWMLLDEERFMDELRQAWLEIRRREDQMRALSVRWTNLENLARFERVQTLLDDFEAAQDAVQAMQRSPRNIPAHQILLEQAAPLERRLREDITALIEYQKTLPPSEEHKQIFTMMADFRGTLGFALSDLRAYLLSGRADFRSGFDANWTRNGDVFQRLARSRNLMTDDQKRVLDRLIEHRAQFAPLPGKMFALREREDWNRANSLLKNNAAPLGRELIAVLNEMVSDQVRLLTQDSARTATDVDRFKNYLLVLTGIALVFTVWLGIGVRSRTLRALDDIVAKSKELAEQEERHRLVVDNAVSGVITIDRAGVILTFNRAAEKMFGYASSEVLGVKVNLLMPEPHVSAHDGYLNNYLETGEAKIIGIGREVEGLRKNGTLFPLELGINAITQGGERQFVGTLTDISERKAAERAKNEFVSTVSHELRTPLTSIKGALGLVQSGVIGELPDKLRSMVEIAYNNSDRLVRLINDILDVEKLSAGKMEFRMAPLDLKGVLEEALVANKAYADQHKVTFALTADLSEAPVTGDYDRLMQMLANLLSNAAKYSPERGEVEISLHRRGESFRVSVVDHGAGIPENFRDMIFERFSQADSSDTRLRGGTGLGLNIAKAIVERHRGTIGFISEVGTGTTFSVDLPARTERPIEVKMPTKTGTEISAAGKPRILHIEDDPDVAQVVLAIVGTRANVLSARTCDEARQLLSREAYDLIVLDLMLPDGDGEDLVDLINGAGDPPPPIIVFSAKDATAQIRKTVRAVHVKSRTTNEDLTSSILSAI